MVVENQTSLPDERGRFGDFGGKFVPETLIAGLSGTESLFAAPSKVEVLAYHEPPFSGYAAASRSQRSAERGSHIIGHPSHGDVGSSTLACVPLRSGWAKSMPESTMATLTPEPFTPPSHA